MTDNAYNLNERRVVGTIDISSSRVDLYVTERLLHVIEVVVSIRQFIR